MLEAQANFFQDLMMPVERYLLTHGCVVLGPSGVGKTTLVNRALVHVLLNPDTTCLGLP